MRGVISLYRLSIGKKIVMAATGLVLFLYVLGHMLGNLKAFQGSEKLNAYAEFLREVGAPALGHGQLLWIIRIVLLVAVGLHAVSAWQLARMSQLARPVAYQHRLERDASTYASRTMRWGGVVIFLFVIYHLLHFTVGSAHPDFVAGSVYRNVVIGFQSWPVASVYVAAMLALGMHLYHGVWSMFQTFGMNHPRHNPFRRLFAAVLAVVIVVGFLAVPVGVLTGILE